MLEGPDGTLDDREAAVLVQSPEALADLSRGVSEAELTKWSCTPKQ